MNLVNFWLNMSCLVQINQNSRNFHFDSIKIFVLIISGKISGRFSGKLSTGIFNQLSDGISQKESYFTGNYEYI